MSEKRDEGKRKKESRMYASIYPLNMSKQCEYTAFYPHILYVFTHSTRIMTIIIMFDKIPWILAVSCDLSERRDHCKSPHFHTSQLKLTMTIDDENIKCYSLWCSIFVRRGWLASLMPIPWERVVCCLWKSSILNLPNDVNDYHFSLSLCL